VLTDKFKVDIVTCCSGGRHQSVRTDLNRGRSRYRSQCATYRRNLRSTASLATLDPMLTQAPDSNSDSRDSKAGHVLTDSRARSRFRSALLAWFDANQRSLPWRKNRSPYRVWLSEIMLQQTRVNAVLDHYRGFLDRFPDVSALAAAPLDEVLAAWSGLGYYRRARALHKAAGIVVQDLNGLFPNTGEGWRKLPGVGRYSAAAIASIAFGEPCAVVDGNVERVLSRLFARDVPHSEQWTLAQLLIARARPGDFNQAFMELGATVCTPRLPQCSDCPVKRWCTSSRTSIPDLLDALAPSLDAVSPSVATKGHSDRPRQKKSMHLLLCRARQPRETFVALLQRSKHADKMAGMWDIPSIGSDTAQASAGTSLLTVRHSITITDYIVAVHDGGTSLPKGARWVPIHKLTSLPLTGLARKILRRLKLI
jgi:A/G-specific adenine glycosylase